MDRVAFLNQIGTLFFTRFHLKLNLKCFYMADKSAIPELLKVAIYLHDATKKAKQTPSVNRQILFSSSWAV